MELKQTVEKYQELIRGFFEDGNVDTLDVHQDCKTVRTFMEQGHPEENIKQAVIEFSPVTNRKLMENEYAANLIHRARDVIKAIDKIKDFDATAVLKADEFSEYRRLAKPHIERGVSLNADTDSMIAFKMMQGGYSRKSVKNAIQELSPVAREVDNTPENYSRFIVKKTARSFEKYIDGVHADFEATVEGKSMHGQGGGIVREFLDKVKSVKEEIKKTIIGDAGQKISVQKDSPGKRYQELFNSIPTDKIDPKPNNVMRDYKNEGAKIIGWEKGWSGQEADVKIAQALLTQGYERHQIHQAINSLSPETAGKAPLEMTKYSQDITQQALTPEIKRQITLKSLSKNNFLEM